VKDKNCMKRIEIIFLLIVTMLFGLSVDNILADTLADSVSIVCNAGELSKKITGSARYTIKKLKIKGGLNATDFGIIRMMAGRDWKGEVTPGKLEVLDISEIVLKPNKDIGCSYRGDSYSTDYRILSDYILPGSLFEATTLKSIICPPQIHTLSGRCFINCNNLESVVAPGVREIGQYAFENCINLLEFDSSNDETTYETVKIGKYCFKGCSKLKRFAFKKSEKMEIGAYAFYDCTSLKTICINADNFLTIGESGFKDCVSLESVQGHYGFCILKGSAFKNCKNLSNFSPNVDEVGDSCFANCEKINELPNNYYSTDITQYGKYSYSNTGFVDLELRGDGGALGEGMFQNCKHLKTIVSYKSIPKNCFDGCTNLEFVKIGSASQIGEDAFDESIYNSCSVRVPKGKYYHYVNGVYGEWHFKNTYSEDVLPTPTISVDRNNNVSIHSYVYDGTLYYHPKGYYPSYVYSEPFQVSKNTVVAALVELEYDDAGHSYYGSNPVGGPVTYTINSFKYDIPTIEVKNNIVTITAKDSLNIDYAINREPTHNTNYTNHYTKPFEISERCTIYAKVYIDARNYSETASYQVRILKLSAPKIVCEHNVVTMSSPEDADIFYTVDGTEPNVLSSLYKEPIRIDKDLEIRAFAVKDEFESSEKTIAKCTYEIGILKLSAPKINCEHNVVTMSSHEDADIFYTVDGTEPNVHSSLYKEPIRIDKNLEIRAFAVKDGYENSEVTIVKCTYVSRTQTITWGEMKAPSVGETIELMATASSGLSVKYSAYAPLSAFKEPIINVNKATFPQEGCYLLVATQEGNEDYDMVADTLQINVVCDDDELMCFDGIYYKLTASKEALKVVRGNLPYKGKVVIPATVNGMPVVEIENNAMYASYFLTEVTIGENISVFGSEAIGACPNLHTIVLPANAALRLPSYCFNCDDKVREIHCLSEDPYVVAESVFNGFLDYEKCVLYVPVGCRNKYIQAPFWKNFTHIEESTPIIVRAKSYSRQYGDENPVFEFETEGAALDGTPEIVCSAVANSPVGSYTIEVKQGSIKNYNVHFESGSLVITKAPLSISAGNYTKKQGDAMPVFKASYAGFKNGENESVLTKQPIFSCDANEVSAPAEYAVTISGAEAENYAISYEQGHLTVVEADAIVVRAKSYNRQYGDENPVFEFETEGAALDGTPEIVCSAVANSPVGAYTIEVKQGSIKNYNVHFESGSLVITKAPLTISAGNYTKKQGDAMPVFKARYAGFKNGEDESVLTKQPVFSCEANEASAPAEYAVTISGADAENYDISYEQGHLTVVEADAIVVRAKSYIRQYGDENPVFEFETEGAALIGEPEIICSADKNSKVGTYEIEINKGTIKNYLVSFVPGTLTVTKAPLVVTADNYTITQGDKLPEFTANYSGFKNGEDESVLTKKPVFSCEANEASAPGEYPITVYDVEADNYEVKNYIAGTLTVLKRELKKQTITWDQEIKAKVGSTIEMNATASSSLPVRYSYVLAPRVESAYRVPQIEGNNITFPEEGTYMLVAIQDGNNEYAAATDTLDVCAISDDEGLMYIDGIYYKYTGDGSALKVVRGYNPYRGKVEIPAYVNGMPVVEIDRQAMYACYYLNDVVIGDNVAICGHEAFGASRNLQKVTLPANQAELRQQYIFNCDDGIKEIHCRSSVPYLADESLFNGFVNYDNCILYVPVGTMQAYTNTEIWRNFIHIVEEDVLTGIPDINVSNDMGAWYTLQGVKLFGRPNLPGVYIHNGKKILVR
jgi:hypothetical protein